METAINVGVVLPSPIVLPRPIKVVSPIKDDEPHDFGEDDLGPDRVGMRIDEIIHLLSSLALHAFHSSHFFLGHDGAEMVHRVGTGEGDAVDLGGPRSIDLEDVIDHRPPFSSVADALFRSVGVATTIGAAIASGIGSDNGGDFGIPIANMGLTTTLLPALTLGYGQKLVLNVSGGGFIRAV